MSANLYYVIYAAAGPAPNAAQVKAGQDSTGSAAVAAGNESSPVVTGTYTFAAAATGLTPATSYRVAFVWSDGTSDSNVSVSDAFSTTSAAIEITGSATGSGTASASITTSIAVTGDASGSATATMELGATSAAIAGDIVCSSAASASLTTAILIAGAATGAATAEATLDGSTPAEIAGDAFASATAFAQITTAILIAGATSGSSSAAMTLFDDADMLENVPDRTMRIPRESRSFRIPAERETMSIRAERAVKVRMSGSRS